jgi:hypothetical protein
MEKVQIRVYPLSSQTAISNHFDKKQQRDIEQQQQQQQQQKKKIIKPFTLSHTDTKPQNKDFLSFWNFLLENQKKKKEKPLF